MAHNNHVPCSSKRAGYGPLFSPILLNGVQNFPGHWEKKGVEKFPPLVVKIGVEQPVCLSDWGLKSEFHVQLI
jgi:hypothetical protein